LKHVRNNRMATQKDPGENELYRSRRHHTLEKRHADDLRRFRLLAIQEELGSLFQPKTSASADSRYNFGTTEREKNTTLFPKRRQIKHLDFVLS
jgi:hypothetical protein